MLLQEIVSQLKALAVAGSDTNSSFSLPTYLLLQIMSCTLKFRVRHALIESE